MIQVCVLREDQMLQSHGQERTAQLMSLVPHQRMSHEKMLLENTTERMCDISHEKS